MKGTTNIYAAGDVTSVQRSGMLIAKAQGMHVAKNLGLVLEGKEEVAYEAGKDVMIVSVGKKAGLGSVAGWRLPSFVVRYVKCPDLFLGLAKGFVDGSGI
jgi:NADH dehydrogenase FAD-containing subunit